MQPVVCGPGGLWPSHPPPPLRQAAGRQPASRPGSGTRTHEAPAGKVGARWAQGCWAGPHPGWCRQGGEAEGDEGQGVVDRPGLLVRRDGSCICSCAAACADLDIGAQLLKRRGHVGVAGAAVQHGLATILPPCTLTQRLHRQQQQQHVCGADKTANTAGGAMESLHARLYQCSAGPAGTPAPPAHPAATQQLPRTSTPSSWSPHLHPQLAQLVAPGAQLAVQAARHQRKAVARAGHHDLLELTQHRLACAHASRGTPTSASCCWCPGMACPERAQDQRLAAMCLRKPPPPPGAGMACHGSAQLN